ncbi:MAG: T9SS type A sorting domain-containing protein, partial [Hymenobacter sp.]|nr:T9SS type A sorting domain-containing protein [Hymenobacter sp.]
TFGTSVIGLEVRRNTVTAHTPNTPAIVDDVYPEGYLNYLEFHHGGTNYRDEQIPVVLGSIFQNNTAINCDNALYLNSGSYNTVVCDLRLLNSANSIKDDRITGVNHASVGTVSCANTPPPPPPPVTNLRVPENPASTVAGLDYKYYEGVWNQLPNFGALPVVRTGTATDLRLTMRQREAHYATQFTGFVTVPTDGQYTFSTTSDDGSKLYIGSTQVVDNDGIHPDVERSGTIGLRAGTHAVTIAYFQGEGGQVLTVSYAGPGINKQPLPAASLRRIAGSGTSGKGAAPLATALRTAGTSLQVYPNPNQGTFTVVYLAQTAQTATLTLTDNLGRLLKQQQVQLRVGNNQLPFQGSNLPQGIYQLTLLGADGQRQVQKVAVNP